jgi:hypothetical protein
MLEEPIYSMGQLHLKRLHDGKSKTMVKEQRPRRRCFLGLRRCLHMRSLGQRRPGARIMAEVRGIEEASKANSVKIADLGLRVKKCQRPRLYGE